VHVLAPKVTHAELNAAAQVSEASMTSHVLASHQKYLMKEELVAHVLVAPSATDVQYLTSCRRKHSAPSWCQAVRSSCPHMETNVPLTEVLMQLQDSAVSAIMIISAATAQPA